MSFVMQDLLKKENLRLKILSKVNGIVLNLDDYESESSLLDFLAAKLFQVGCDMVLLKKSEKYSDSKFLQVALKIKQLTAQFGATLIVEHHVLLSAIINADSIILNNNDFSINLIKEYLPENILIGWSSSEEDISSEVDYLFFEFNSKPTNTNYPYLTIQGDKITAQK